MGKYTVKSRCIWDSESDDGQKTVFDVFDPEGELVYTGCDWETAQRYLSECPLPKEGDGYEKCDNCYYRHTCGAAKHEFNGV